MAFAFWLSAGSSRGLSLGLPTTVDSPRTTKSKPNIPRPSFMQPQPALCSGALPLRPLNDFFHRFLDIASEISQRSYSFPYRKSAPCRFLNDRQTCLTNFFQVEPGIAIISFLRVQVVSKLDGSAQSVFVR